MRFPTEPCFATAGLWNYRNNNLLTLSLKKRWRIGVGWSSTVHKFLEFSCIQITVIKFYNSFDLSAMHKQVSETLCVTIFFPLVMSKINFPCTTKTGADFMQTKSGALFQNNHGKGTELAPAASGRTEQRGLSRPKYRMASKRLSCNYKMLQHTAN